MNGFDVIFDLVLLTMCAALLIVCSLALAKAIARRERWRVFVMSCSVVGISFLGYGAWLGVKSTDHQMNLLCIGLGCFIQWLPDILQWLVGRLKHDNKDELVSPPQMP